MSTVADLVTRARQRIANLSPGAVADDVSAVLVDLREPAEIASTGIIPNAVCIPRGLLEFKADPTSPAHDPRLDPRARTVLYCATGGRSALAAAVLVDLGYHDVGHLDGGVCAWTEAGHDLTPK